VVYELSAAGHYTVLYTFTGGAGGSASGGLIRDSAGNFYGLAGGGAVGVGLVYELSAAGLYSVLYTFTAGADGGQPNSLILDPNGGLYGTASAWGQEGGGLIFRLVPP
jgi:hypothetical protein